MDSTDCSPIPGRTYRTRDPDVTFVAVQIVESCVIIYGTDFHRWTGFVGPSHRLLNGRVSNESEPPRDLIVMETDDEQAIGEAILPATVAMVAI